MLMTIGNKNKFNFKVIDSKDVSTIEFDLAIIFGKNGAGKTTLFKSLNTKFYYPYSDFNKNLILFEKNPIFINCNGKISRKKREPINEDFFWNIAKLYSQISFSVYKTWYKNNQKIKNIKNRQINIKHDIKIKNGNTIPKPNYFCFEYYPISFKEFQLLKNKILEIIKQHNDSKFLESLKRAIFVKAKLPYNIINSLEEEDKKNITLFFNIIYCMKKNHSFLFNTKNLKEIIEKIFKKYRDEFIYYLKEINKENFQQQEQNKIKIKSIRDFIKNKIKNGKSLSIKKFNNILNNIYDSLENSTIFVLDDAFDGMDDRKSYDLSLVIDELIKKGLKFLLLTNSINSLRHLKHLDQQNRFKILMLENTNNEFLLEDVSEVSNLIFKYNDKEYYKDIDKFLNSPYNNSTIKNYLVAYHRQTLWEAKQIKEFINKADERFACKDNVVETIYDILTKLVKKWNNNKENLYILDPKYKVNESEVDWYLFNSKINQLFYLNNGSTNNFLFTNNYGNVFFINMFAKLSLQTLVEESEKQIENSTCFCTSTMEQLKEIFEEFQPIRDQLAHPKEHLFIWAYLIVDNQTLWLEFFDFIINKITRSKPKRNIHNKNLEEDMEKLIQKFKDKKII